MSRFFRRRGALYTPINAGTVGGGSGEEPPVDPGDFIPNDADWYFKASEVSQTTRNSWNVNAVANSGTGVNKWTDVNLGGGRILKLKNQSTQITSVGPNSPFVGAMRVYRNSTAPFTRPDGVATNDYDDEQNSQCAHNHAEAYGTDGTEWGAVPYGTRFEVGYKFRVVNGASGGHPDDGDSEAWDNASIWCVIGSMSTSSNPTTEYCGLYLAYYSAGRAMFPKTSWLSSSGEENDQYHTPTGILNNTDSGWSPRKLANSDGKPWNFNTWYTVRMIGVCNGTDAPTSWANWYLDDMNTPWMTARNIRMGKHGSSVAETWRCGTYQRYNLDGYRRSIIMDECYIKRGGSTSPPS